MDVVILAIYLGLSYHFINKMWWSKHVYVYANTLNFYMGRLVTCLFIGWAAIPIGVIYSLVHRD